ncbi:5'-methylthioadenosine/S-adenosylhomocysteine nucleosidase [Oceanobacillus halotolerans]|uniref:5'-methylthioadenosine/S-adenosylhomocysteine nucleosidase n=1 Tax=Oceanobacillus halotolerans TaxID=2663380 RepID=UPI0013DCC84C|nr:5'-methylthioadenosine/S-adenosylhomocysteine nucleosidase [Oceanobacillus halotolerans]
MTIGIIGAMDEEVKLIIENMTNKQERTVANCLFVRGKLLGKDVVLLKSGIGKVNAAMATTIMHERFSPSHVINTGSAGGYDPELEVGDIVISSEVVHHDVDVTAFNYAYGQVPQMPATFKGDPELIKKTIKALEGISVSYKTGLVATGDSFMDNPERVKFVQSMFPNMIALEMEAAAVAQVCHQFGKPFVVIRALSDIAGKESSVSFDTFLDKAARNATTILMSVIQDI